jgi:hypothetical protein
MKIFPLFTVAFLATDHSHKAGVDPLKTTKKEAEECFTLKVRRRLLERFVNNERYLPLKHPDLHPGDIVKQKSLLLDPDTQSEVGIVHTLANMLDEDVRLAHGAYNITSGDRIGVINFSALIPNYLATDHFDMAITSGTGQFHSAQGYILVGKPEEANGFLERDATFYICGLYE